MFLSEAFLVEAEAPVKKGLPFELANLGYQVLVSEKQGPAAEPFQA